MDVPTSLLILLPQCPTDNILWLYRALSSWPSEDESNAIDIIRIQDYWAINNLRVVTIASRSLTAHSRGQCVNIVWKPISVYRYSNVRSAKLYYCCRSMGSSYFSAQAGVFFSFLFGRLQDPDGASYYLFQSKKSSNCWHWRLTCVVVILCEIFCWAWPTVVRHTRSEIMACRPKFCAWGITGYFARPGAYTLAVTAHLAPV